MKVIFVENAFEEEVVNGIIEDVESYINQEPDDLNIKMYIEGYGGQTKELFKMVHFINSINDVVNFELYANNCLQSASLLLFLMTKCYKEILPDTWGMTHNITRMLAGDKVNNRMLLDGFIKQEHLDFINDRLYKFLDKCGVEEDKIEQVKEGKDVFFNTEELIELINASNEIDGYNFFY